MGEVIVGSECRLFEVIMPGSVGVVLLFMATPNVAATALREISAASRCLDSLICEMY